MNFSDFDDVEAVVSDPLRFKLKLGIGEDAYASIRYGKTVQELWDVGGVAATGASLAASSTVASTFFGGGWLAAIGIGVATTPVGWVIAAGAASAGTYYGVMRMLGKYKGSRVRQVPEFINTPIDLLGAALLDLIGTLAIKMGQIDGDYCAVERASVESYFVEEWGYDKAYASRALQLIEESSKGQSLKEAVQVLARFKRDNPDCNYSAMQVEILRFLQEIVEADGEVDEREEMALEKVEAILEEAGRFSIGRTLSNISRASSVAKSKLRTIAESALDRSKAPSIDDGD